MSLAASPGASPPVSLALPLLALPLALPLRASSTCRLPRRGQPHIAGGGFWSLAGHRLECGFRGW